MIHRVASTNGVDLAVHDFGGDGPPLVMLHATGMHGRCYQAIGEQLTDVRRVFAPDLRGHGDSSLPDVPVSWAGMADDALAVIDWLDGDDPIDMVGHSMGGGTVAATELRRPGTVATGWLFEPVVWPESASRDDNAMAAQALRRRPTFGSVDEIIERYGSRPPFDTVRPDVLRSYVEHGFRPVGDGVTLKCAPETEAAVFNGVPTGVFERLGEITTPLTVVGSGDGYPPARVAPLVAEALPAASFHYWRDNTHFGPFEDPERAAAEIRAGLS